MDGSRRTGPLPGRRRHAPEAFPRVARPLGRREDWGTELTGLAATVVAERTARTAPAGLTGVGCRGQRRLPAETPLTGVDGPLAGFECLADFLRTEPSGQRGMPPPEHPGATKRICPSLRWLGRTPGPATRGDRGRQGPRRLPGPSPPAGSRAGFRGAGGDHCRSAQGRGRAPTRRGPPDPLRRAGDGQCIDGGEALTQPWPVHGTRVPGPLRSRHGLGRCATVVACSACWGSSADSRW